MQIKIEVVKGKITSGGDRLKEHFTSLDDGAYILELKGINPLTTPRDYQKAYFDKIDICVQCTGNDRYTIHDAFKKHTGIESTKELTIVDWRNILDKLSWWAYDKFDCIV